jgi:hypothetical protein
MEETLLAPVMQELEWWGCPLAEGGREWAEGSRQETWTCWKKMNWRVRVRLV